MANDGAVAISAKEYNLLCKRAGILPDEKAVSLVFCKFCRFSSEKDGKRVCTMLSWRNSGEGVTFYVGDRFFCAWGERRAD